MNDSVDLDTHIADVVNLVRCEDLRDVVLMAHSYGGMPVTGAVEVLADRVRAIVYLDAFVPHNGDSGALLGGVEPQSQLSMPAPPIEYFGLGGDDGAWVDQRLTPHPSACTNQPIALQDEAPTLCRTYVLATGWNSLDHFQKTYDDAVADPGWTAYTLDGSHDLMIDRPEEMAEIPVEAAR